MPQSKETYKLNSKTQPKKYVLTGAPCSGKTTLLNKLASKGFQVISEVARMIIERELKKNSDVLPWVNRDKFQREVMRKQIELEAKLKPWPPAFLDRGIPDGIAFYLLDGLEPPKELVELSRKNRYDKIFLLELIPEYEKDHVRREDPEQAQKLQELILKVYTDLDYEVIVLPPGVEKRVKLVMKYISEDDNE